ncbi:Uu.00g099150.m01.CDS01 [Anthostomella pinea]|uniref:Uu.00g099150.m01.CDS01 n=1 Tax=Anthostomella pinea TaxID=933095 RepID=A0AAI8VCU4_9PEZI|nr:Uu.00g099150.m01.CDS01 [Anthostomella pinea]
MSDIDLDISNGSCWANVNVALPDQYIPCGNAADGRSHACCHVGDKCVSSGACYHANYRTTYVAGCTNQNYDGSECQNKGNFYNQQWVGLARCDPELSLWAGCPEENEVVGDIPPPTNCTCTGSTDDNILFQDAPQLADIAMLPQRSGEAISWFPGHEPTDTGSVSAPKPTRTNTTSTTDTPSTSASGNDPQATSNPGPSSASSADNGLSTGATAGIAVGASIGGLIVICLVVIALLLRRRKKKEEEENAQETLPHIQNSSARPSHLDTPALPAYKSELAADEPKSATTISSAGFAGNLDRHSSMSEVSSMHDGSGGRNMNPGQVSPQSTGGQEGFPQMGGGSMRVVQPAMAPIHELPG